ncbi:MAG: hypothetical protein IKR73_05070, partial [Oscillospiraceae bacterium]|nr:hypothetical protein [Oscillospiraceae bacterium]
VILPLSLAPCPSSLYCKTIRNGIVFVLFNEKHAPDLYTINKFDRAMPIVIVKKQKICYDVVIDKTRASSSPTEHGGI